jgi:tRNA dimethylallyltransferase
MIAQKKAVFVVGPTGAGKSAFAFELAKIIRGEIISADSMQVYRGMNIGTDKPSASARRRVRHHLLDILDPSAEFSAYEFRRRALEAMDDVIRRGRIPIVAGGTGLYIKALIDGISPQPGKDEDVRKELLRTASSRGLGFLYERLSEVDPPVARRVHPHDEKRIIRALEVYTLSGRPLSEWENETVGLGQLGYEFFLFGVRRGREELYREIDRRVEGMFRKGLVKEASKLYKKKTLSLTARQAIGYAELFEHFAGKRELADAKALIQRHTRNLAKRQMIWFRRDARIRWIDRPGREGAEEIAAQCA